LIIDISGDLFYRVCLFLQFCGFWYM